MREVHAVDGSASRATWSPGGQWVALCEESAVSVRDVTDASREVFRVPVRGRVSVGWRGDELLAVLTEDGALRAWWIPDGGEANTAAGEGRVERSEWMSWRDGHAAFARRGTELALEVWDLGRWDRWQHTAALTPPKKNAVVSPEAMAVHPDGHTVAVLLSPRGGVAGGEPSRVALIGRGEVTWCALDAPLAQCLHLDWFDATTLLVAGVDSAWRSTMWRVDLDDAPETPRVLRRQSRRLPGTGPKGPSSYCSVDVVGAKVSWSLQPEGRDLVVETFDIHAPDRVVTGRLAGLESGATAALHPGRDRLVIARHDGATGDVTLHDAALDGGDGRDLARVRLRAAQSYGMALHATRDAAMVSVGLSPADGQGWRTRTGWVVLDA